MDVRANVFLGRCLPSMSRVTTFHLRYFRLGQFAEGKSSPCTLSRPLVLRADAPWLKRDATYLRLAYRLAGPTAPWAREPTGPKGQRRESDGKLPSHCNQETVKLSNRLKRVDRTGNRLGRHKVTNRAYANKRDCARKWSFASFGLGGIGPQEVQFCELLCGEIRFSELAISQAKLVMCAGLVGP